MEGLEKLYLLFSTDGLYYLLPVSKMERILDGRDIPDGLAVADVSEITGGSGDMGKSDRQYIILLKEEGGHGLLVEHITGMLEVHEGELISLPEPVLSGANRYLKAVYKLKNEEAVWAYAVDPGIFAKPEDSAEDKRRREPRVPDRMPGGTYISLEYGGRRLYVDKESVSAVVSSPRIQRVPGAEEEILGIADYQGKVVVYYNPVKMGGTKQAGAGSLDYTCGIILEQGDWMIGIPCSDIGGQEEVPDDLLPVINGVGAKSCD